MKNKVKVIGIITLVAVIVFTIMACNKDGKVIPVRVKATNNNGIQPSLAMVQEARSSMEIMASAGDFDALDPYYSYLATLGSKQTFTPTEFTLYYFLDAYLSNGERFSLGMGLNDFTKGLTVNVGEIETGITVSAFSLAFASSGPHGSPKITYEGSSDIHFECFYIQGDGVTTAQIDSITFYGSERKLHDGTLTGPGGTTIPNPPYPTGGPMTLYQVVIPFSPITIPDSANSATLNISMDLSYIVERYGTSGNYKHALKKNWWDHVYLTATY